MCCFTLIVEPIIWNSMHFVWLFGQVIHRSFRISLRLMHLYLKPLPTLIFVSPNFH